MALPRRFAAAQQALARQLIHARTGTFPALETSSIGGGGQSLDIPFSEAG